MKRIKLARVLALLATLALTLSSAVQAQDKAINSRTAKAHTHGTPTYSPRITGRSNSIILEGRITEIRDDLVSIKTARGTHYDFKLDDQTTILNSDELISIATMSDITLTASDLRTGDRVEIVAERTVARIVTRIASSNSHIASR